MTGAPDDAVPLVDTLKRSARVLRESGVPFALGGGFAVYAWGGVMPEHDVDFFVREQDADRALAALAADGLRIERPPEDWLVKAWDGGNLVDVIYRPAGIAVDDDLLASAVQREVAAVPMPVLRPTTVLAMRVLAMNEHYCDYARLLLATRTVRELIDWSELAELAARTPFGAAFLVLVAGLGIEPAAREGAGAAMLATPEHGARREPDGVVDGVLDMRRRSA